MQYIGTFNEHADQQKTVQDLRRALQQQVSTHLAKNPDQIAAILFCAPQVLIPGAVTQPRHPGRGGVFSPSGAERAGGRIGGATFYERTAISSGLP